MRPKTWIACCVLLIVPISLYGAVVPVCGEHDLMFGCTKTDEKGRLRAGCGVHEGGRFFASDWRIYDLQTEEVLKSVHAGADGIALVEVPKQRWFILEGELKCSAGAREIAIPYRFLVERIAKDSFVQRPYSPETLVATGNWNEDTQLHYGAFRTRSLLGTGGEAAPVSR